MRNAFMFAMVSLMLFGAASAIPCQPNQFYGAVAINGIPASDGILIEAKISGVVVATTITRDGRYDYNLAGTNVFQVPDPDCNNEGKIVKFYVGGVYAAEAVFHNGYITELDLSINTVCGNDVCETGETSSNCCTDCGCSSGYACENNTCVLLCGNDVCDGSETCATCPADCLGTGQVCCNGTAYTGTCCVDTDCQSGYACSNHSCVAQSSGPSCGDANCDSGENCSNCADDCGCSSGFVCSGGSCVAQSSPPPVITGGGSSNPYCGDDVCNNGETCSTCESDCGCCAPECDSDSDCNDNDECTTDACVTQDECTGECTYTAIESCTTVPGECAEGETKCEGDAQYNCEFGPFESWVWSLGDECAEGCCGDVCCGSEGALGITGFFAGVSGIVLPFGIAIVLIAVILFLLFGRKK